MTSLGAVCEALVDCEHKTAPKDPSGAYWAVGTPAMREGRIDYQQARRISRSTFDEWTRRLRPRAGDILLAREAPVGLLVQIPEEENVAPGQRTVLLRPDTAQVLPRFLFYLLTEPGAQARLREKAEGSTVPHLNVSDIRSFELPELPPIEEQRGIAATLGALDEKIDANRRLASLCDSLAAALFAQADAAVVGVTSMSSVATIVLGGTPDRTRPEFWSPGSVPWLNSGKANEARVVEPSELISVDGLERSAAKLMPKRASIIAITGATLGQVARLEIDAAGNQSLIGVWADDPALNDWLHFALRARVPSLVSNATGAAQQHVNKGDVEDLEVPLLGPADLERWGARIRPLLDRAAAAERERLLLAALRDSLLPELLSGRIRVPEAREAVDAVAAQA